MKITGPSLPVAPGKIAPPLAPGVPSTGGADFLTTKLDLGRAMGPVELALADAVRHGVLRDRVHVRRLVALRPVALRRRGRALLAAPVGPPDRRGHRRRQARAGPQEDLRPDGRAEVGHLDGRLRVHGRLLPRVPRRAGRRRDRPGGRLRRGLPAHAGEPHLRDHDAPEEDPVRRARAAPRGQDVRPDPRRRGSRDRDPRLLERGHGEPARPPRAAGDARERGDRGDAGGRPRGGRRESPRRADGRTRERDRRAPEGPRLPARPREEARRQGDGRGAARRRRPDARDRRRDAPRDGALPARRPRGRVRPLPRPRVRRPLEAAGRAGAEGGRALPVERDPLLDETERAPQAAREPAGEGPVPPDAHRRLARGELVRARGLGPHGDPLRGPPEPPAPPDAQRVRRATRSARTTTRSSAGSARRRISSRRSSPRRRTSRRTCSRRRR